jgi:hypothetical protein
LGFGPKSPTHMVGLNPFFKRQCLDDLKTFLIKGMFDKYALVFFSVIFIFFFFVFFPKRHQKISKNSKKIQGPF